MTPANRRHAPPAEGAFVRYIITGAAGFVGSHLAEQLAADGHRVIGIDCFSPYYARADKESNLAGLRHDPRFELIEGDVATMPLGRVFTGRPIVIHLAAQPGVRASFGEGFANYVHDNILATQAVLEAAHTTGVSRVVYASSSSVYGDAPVYPSLETDLVLRPRSPYGATKRACEDLADIYRSSGLEVSGLRFFTVYGPRQRPDMAFRRLCEAICTGRPFELNGDGQQSRDFTHVNDVVSAITLASRSTECLPIINVGGGHEATMNEVIEMLGDLAGTPVPLVRRDAQRGDVRRTGADTTLARTRLGWQPTVDLRTGLADTLSWVRGRHTAPAHARPLAARGAAA
jgi:UDP-glucuronate 4-epimerase